jgi:hypothetical protein
MGQYTTSHLLLNILGSIVQYKGVAHGLAFDPVSMTPLVHQTPFARALTLYRQLAALMPDTEVVDVDDASLMTSGRCALGFSWSGKRFSTVAGCLQALAKHALPAER